MSVKKPSIAIIVWRNTQLIWNPSIIQRKLCPDEKITYKDKRYYKLAGINVHIPASRSSKQCCIAMQQEKITLLFVLSY